MDGTLGLADLAGLILAAGAIGTAAMGIVDTLKSRRSLRLAGVGIDGLWRRGFNGLLAALEPLQPALGRTFGDRWRDVLELHWRGDHSPASIRRVISRSVRLGLPELNQAQLGELAGRYGNLDRASVFRAMTQLREGQPLDTGSHVVLERLMAAIEAEIEGAALRAAADYRDAARAAASLIALLLGVLVAVFVLATGESGAGRDALVALLLGVVAVPAAPIAKDLSTAIRNFAVRP